MALVKYEELSATALKIKSDSQKLRELQEKYNNLIKTMEWEGGASEYAKVALNEIRNALVNLEAQINHLSVKADEEVQRHERADSVAYKDSNL